ncbi:MAG: alpha/beta family hydrolase [Candidatus Brocadiia bacterium]
MNEPQGNEEENIVTVEAYSAELEGNLLIPDGAQGIVVFAHGSGSSRHSPRNKFVARHLREAGLATLLFDLLTAEEDAVDKRTREYRFDIGLLAERLVGATDWLLEQPEAAGLNIGYFGSSTGSAAALIGASERTEVVGAVVSRGGRVDMAESALPQVEAPTLFIVGGRDPQVLELNRRMLPALQVEKELEIVEGAGHLFEEPGALEEVADLAREWFVRHLTQT